METSDLVINGDTELICDGESFWVSSALLQARGVWWSPCSLGMGPSASSTDSVTVIFPDHTKHELNNFINAVYYDIFKNSDVLQGFNGFSVNEIPSFRLGIALGNELDDGKSITVYKERIPWRPWTSQSSVLSSAMFRRSSTSARGVSLSSSPRVTSIRQAMYKNSPVRPPLRDRIKSRCQEMRRRDRDNIVSGVRNISKAAVPGDQVKEVLTAPGVGDVDQNIDNHELQGEFEKFAQVTDTADNMDNHDLRPLVDTESIVGGQYGDSKLDGQNGSCVTVRLYHNSPVFSERLPSQQVPEMEEVAHMNSSHEDISKVGNNPVSELGVSLRGGSGFSISSIPAINAAEDDQHQEGDVQEVPEDDQHQAGDVQEVPEDDQHQAGDVQEVPDDAATAGGDQVALSREEGQGRCKNTSGKVYQCEFCASIFEEGKQFRDHMRKHKYKECTICNMRLSANTTLPYHMMRCSKTRNIQCPQCEYKCSTQVDLKKHLKTCSPAKEHKCDNCEFIGKSRQELRIHMKEHPKFGCDRCGKTFRKQSTLTRHVDAHEAHTVVTSKGDWFKIDDSVMVNERSKQKESKLYHCLQCSYKSRKNFNLKVHVLRIHDRPQPQKVKIKPKCKKCGFTSLSAWNVRRHQNTCPGPGSGKITLQKVIELCVNTNCSFTDVKKIRKMLFETYGRGAVEPNVFIKLTKLLKDLSVWWTTEVIELQENSKSKKGKLGKTCVSYIKKLKQFEDWVINLRGIKNAKVSYSFDGGQFKCVGVLNIHDLDRPGEPDIQGHLSTGSRLTLPFLQADMGRRFGENHYNVKKLLSLIEFPESADFQFAQDYKLRNIILGIIGTNGRFPCGYATCYKVDEAGNPTTRRGRQLYL